MPYLLGRFARDVAPARESELDTRVEKVKSSRCIAPADPLLYAVARRLK